MKPFSHQRYNYFYQFFLVDVTLPVRCLWYDFIIRLCHPPLPPHFLFWPKLHAASPTSGISEESPLREKKAVTIFTFLREARPYLVTNQRGTKNLVLLAVIKEETELCDVCSFFRNVFGLTTRPSVCLSGRGELSKPSCCHGMRVNSWSWSALAWASLGQFTNVWRGWMAACTP